MFKHFLPALALGFCPLFSFTQSTFLHLLELPGQKWSHGHSVAAFDTSRLYLGGYRHADGEPDRAVLAVFNASGAFLWGKTYAIPTYNQHLEWIEQNPDGTLMLLLARYSAGATNLGLVKTTTDGAVIWSWTYTANGEIGIRMLRLADGYLLCGSEKNGVPESMLHIKLDFDGQVLWEHVLTPPGINNHFISMAESPDGSIYLAGNYDGGSGSPKNILVKIAAPFGLVQWAKTYQTSAGNSLFRDLVTLSDGTVVVGGLGATDPSGLAAWMLHVNAQGEVLTSHTLSYDDTQSYLDISNLTRTPDDQVAMTLSPGILAKLSADAETEWAYRYAQKQAGQPYPLFLFQVRNVPGGGYLATGSYQPASAMALVKTDAQGRVEGCCLTAVPIQRTAFPASPQQVALAPQNASPVDTIALQVEAITPSLSSFCETSSLDLHFTLSDSVICPSECVTLDLGDPVQGFDVSILIPPGAEAGQPHAVCFPKAGEYNIQVRVEKAGCWDTLLSQPLRVKSASDQFPNAFTPDGDEVNDVFRPIYACPVLLADFSVYNRWGQLVFQTHAPDQGWDGSFQGKPAPADVYVWRVSYDAVRENGQQRIAEQGEVTLLR